MPSARLLPLLDHSDSKHRKQTHLQILFVRKKQRHLALPKMNPNVVPPSRNPAKNRYPEKYLAVWKSRAVILQSVHLTMIGWRNFWRCWQLWVVLAWYAQYIINYFDIYWTTNFYLVVFPSKKKKEGWRCYSSRRNTTRTQSLGMFW